MKHPRLFLGFMADKAFNTAIQELSNPILADIFINNDDYLHKVQHQQEILIGKFIPQKSQLHHLYLLESNIQSIVTSKLIPHYDFKKNPVRLFPIQDER
ncbi:MAG: hypothetical protein GWP59_00290 [Chlamydiales bacterium]|nr:hypothetical protein [Chlamydiales bacterium]